MAINKKLIHFNKKSTFNSQKLSANSENTQYQVGGTGTVQTGAPDINYQSIVYIKDSKEIWTHGQFYGTTDSGNGKNYYPGVGEGFGSTASDVFAAFGSKEKYIAFRNDPSKYDGMRFGGVVYKFTGKSSERVSNSHIGYGIVTTLGFYRAKGGSSSQSGLFPSLEFVNIYDELHEDNSGNPTSKYYRVVIPNDVYSLSSSPANCIVTKKPLDAYINEKLTWSAITGKPSFATVATSGSYNDLSDKPTIPSTNIDDLYIKVNVKSLTFPVTDRDTINNAFGGKLSEFLSDTSKYGGVMLTTSYTTSGYVYLPLVSDFTASNGTRKVFCVADTSKGITSVSLIINDSSIKFNSGVVTYANSEDVATATVAGTVKLGSDHLLNIDNIHNDQGNTMSRYYAVRVNSKGQMGVNVPWQNTTDVTPASTASIGGFRLMNNTKSKQYSVPIYNVADRTYAVQLTESSQAVVNVPWTDTEYTLPTASASVLGGIKIGSGLSISNGVVSTGNYVSNVEVGSSSTDWQSAYIPMTVSYRDGSTADREIVLPMATGDGEQGSAGLMSGADKKKLDGLSISGVPNKIESTGTSVTCTDSDVVATTGDTTISMNGDGIEIELIAGDANMTLGPTDLTVNANIQVSGKVKASLGFFDTSDARVKTNVKELDASKADKVRLVEFDRTDIEHHGYGVIAQELEEVYPEMVNIDKDGFKSVNYDELAMVKIKYLEDKVARLEALVGRLLTK